MSTGNSETYIIIHHGIPVCILYPSENCYQTKQMVDFSYQTISLAVKYAGLHNSQ